MAAIIIVFCFLFVALILTDDGQKVDSMDEYCSLECWSWKIRKLKKCC